LALQHRRPAGGRARHHATGAGGLEPHQDSRQGRSLIRTGKPLVSLGAYPYHAMKACGNSRHLACDIPFPLPRRLSPLPGVPTSIRFSHKEYAMDPILILVADQARARILMSETRASSPMEISDLVNPQGRAHEGDLI